MFRILSLLTTFCLMVTVGVVEGRWTNRWQSSSRLAEATARLDELPLSVADWQGKAEPLDPKQLVAAQLTGGVVCNYVHRHTGANVSIMLVCGRPGPVARHPPEICYQGQGYVLHGAPTRQVLARQGDAPEDSFWLLRFDREEAGVRDYLRLFYAWTASGRWEASDTPRFTFANSGALYKLYIMEHPRRLDEPLDQSPVQEFMHAFLPKLQQVLFPTPEGS
jgi:hypothetical protein